VKHIILFILLRPEAPVTINMGFEMPSWFDIKSLDKNDGHEDEEGVKLASRSIVKIIEDEVRFTELKIRFIVLHTLYTQQFGLPEN
jgi:predicted esterase